MKKTFITAALSLCTALAYGTDYTTTTTGTGTGNGTYYGWCTALTHSYLTTTPESLQTTDVLTLNSISIVGGTGSGGTLTDGAKLAIFKYSSDSNVGSFVGISDNVAVRTAGESFTFSFSDVNLTAGQQYQFLFVSTTATAATFTTDLAEGTTMLSAYQAVAGSVRHQVHNHSSIPGGDGTYKSSGMNSWEGAYVTSATYSLSTLPVPEPTTATLSLLALAGLAARRRRK